MFQEFLWTPHAEELVLDAPGRASAVQCAPSIVLALYAF